MMKRLILLTLLAIFVLGGIYFLYKNRPAQNNQNKIQVTASFYPYYFFASLVGGDKASVANITPSGAEPHDYEPSPQDLIQIESSKFLVLNGVVEPWALKIKNDLKGKPTDVLEINQSLFTQKVADKEGLNSTDPHIWISPRLAKIQVLEILKEFVKVDPQNIDYYTTNANTLVFDLNKIDSDYKAGLANCKSKDIITSHAAFGYLATDYGLKQVSIAGLSPDAEPSLKQLTEIANFAKANNIKYIFFESLVSPKLSETIATNIGAKTLILNPIEGLTPKELSQSKNYLTTMEDNLKNLRIALQCQ